VLSQVFLGLFSSGKITFSPQRHEEKAIAEQQLLQNLIIKT